MPEDYSLQGLLDQLSSKITLAVNRPTIHKYVPHVKQEIFHRSTKQGRLYIGGNRSGKTVGGIVEDIWWLTGTHPYLDTPKPPVFGRIVTVDYDNGWELIIKPELQRWLPPTALVNGSWEDSWHEKKKIPTLANGSRLDIMSYVQAAEKQAGTSRDFVHFDEEPPSTLFDENKMRLLDRKGRYWITMTPVEGITWTYDRLFEKAKNGSDPLVDVIEVNVYDNPYINDSDIEDYLDGMDDESKEARREGKYNFIGGLIFKSFDYSHHVIPQVVPPTNWTWIRSFDHGFNNPTAWMYHAVAPDGTVVTFHEHYKREMTISEHVKHLKFLDTEVFGKVPEVNVGDPAIKQRMANTGKSVHREYAELGIGIRCSNNAVDIGIDQMNWRFKSSTWFITENCRNLIWELRRYKWKTRTNKKLQEMHGNQDVPHKKDDHAIDSCRYLFINRPAPRIESDDTRKKQLRAQIESLLTPTMPVLFGRRFDLSIRAATGPRSELNESPSSSTEWTTVDEHMGGIF